MPKTFTQEGYVEKMQQKLWEQCEGNEFCDVVFSAGSEEKRISAHRNVLSAASDYFTRMFASPMRESISKEVKMPSVDSDVLQHLVEYCYTGSLTISEDIAVELLETAHLLLLSSVVAACESFLVEQLNLSNCIRFVHVAERYDCETLLRKAETYILENFMEIYRTDEFLNLNVKQLGRLLRCDELCVSDEEDVFHSVEAWIQQDPNERAKHKVELLKFVRMPLLKLSFLMEHVNSFCISTDCQNLYKNALELQLSSYGGLNQTSNALKPRNSTESLLMAITRESETKMFLHYFCSQRRKWMKSLNSLEYRIYFGLAIMEDDLLIIGGRNASRAALNTSICLNLKTLTYKPVASMNTYRSWCSAAVLDGFLYAVGGKVESGPTNSVERWDPKTNKWDFVASMSVKRSNVLTAVLNGKLYAFGGYDYDIMHSSAECYDPNQNVWQSIASISSPLFHQVAVANGLLYAVGGFSNNAVERYDPKANKWSTISSSRGVALQTTTFRDKVTTFYSDRVEQYDDTTNEWKPIGFLDGLANAWAMFTYSNKLLTSEFAYN